MITRRVLVGSAAAWALGCAGLPVGRSSDGAPPILDPKGKRRPTTGRVKKLPAGFERLGSTQDGLERESLLYVPGQRKAPLLIGLHGNEGSSQSMFGNCGLGPVIRERGWFGLFPECDVWAPTDPSPDHGDLRYLSSVLDRVLGDYPIDRSRVWAVGFSGGGMRAYRLAAHRSDRVAAVAACGATIGHTGTDAWDPRATGAKPVSILHVHGKRDKTVDPKGGPLDGHPGVRRISVVDGLQAWADQVGAREVGDPLAPDRCPSSVGTRRWEAKGGWSIQAVLDPALDHRWAPYMNEALVEFLDEAPRRV